MHRRDGLAAVLRAGQWWETKLAPALALAYATALISGTPLADVLPAIGTLLLALASGGAGVSILNDLADRHDDAAAHKPNRMAGRGPAEIAVIAALPIGGTVLAAYLWRDAIPALVAMAAAWICFAAYSLPPLRLKARGAWGVIADAGGAHLFPALMAISAVAAAPGHVVPRPWAIAIATWALAYGIRGILGHQLADEDNDRASGSASLVVRIGRERSRRIAAYAAFPAECAAMAFFLWQIDRPEPWTALAIMIVLIFGRIVYFQMRPVVCENVPRFFIVGQDFYTVLLPLALLIAAARQHSGDGVVLVMHLALFPFAAAMLARDSARIVVRAIRGHHLIGK